MPQTSKAQSSYFKLQNLSSYTILHLGLHRDIFIRGAAATAKSLQSCPTLCDPIDSSPPGYAVPGILQARTLEWLAISFSNQSQARLKQLSTLTRGATESLSLPSPFSSPGLLSLFISSSKYTAALCWFLIDNSKSRLDLRICL